MGRVEISGSKKTQQHSDAKLSSVFYLIRYFLFPALRKGLLQQKILYNDNLEKSAVKKR